ncbi:endonuclease/exonuclease/phosphatase family protein [Profundibacter sp.]|uniref:endonuclease/exonuclease/phosphatase family protein n=1 Tax=Profundibacter sp. TaxID=3101071 RepID=UPI003D0CEDAD
MFLRFIALICLFVLGASHFGALHPLGDSLAVFRGVLTIVGAVAVLVLVLQRRWVLTALGAGLVLLSAYTVLMPRFTFSAALDVPYALYQKNMSFRMPDTAMLATDILQQAPDFVTLEEVDRENLGLLGALKSDYPAQAFCPFAFVGGVAVASRWPKVAGSDVCLPGQGMVAMQVETPGGPLWLVALHLHWPFPHGQAAQVRRLEPALKALEGLVVLGGDFNMVPWSQTMRAITAATKTRRVGAPKYTFPLFDGLYMLPIDHVLVNANTRPAETWRRPQLGSDHFGLLARFYLR